MNRFFKHLSLSVIVLSLITHANTHGMLTNKLAKKPISKQYIKRTYLNTEKTKELQRDALKVSTHLITHKNAETKCATLKLLDALVKKNQGYDAAISAASSGIYDNNERVQISSVKLIRTLVEENQASEIAAQLAAIGIRSEYFLVRHESIEVFKDLFNKNQAFEIAEKSAETSLMSSNSAIRGSGIQLLTILFDKNYALKTGLKTAEHLFYACQEDHGMRYSGLAVYDALTQRNHNFESAIQAVLIGMGSKDQRVQQYSSSLFDRYLALINTSDKTRC